MYLLYGCLYQYFPLLKKIENKISDSSMAYEIDNALKREWLFTFVSRKSFVSWKHGGNKPMLGRYEEKLRKRTIPFNRQRFNETTGN